MVLMMKCEKINKLARQNNLLESLNRKVKGGIATDHVPRGCCILEDKKE